MAAWRPPRGRPRLLKSRAKTSRSPASRRRPKEERDGRWPAPEAAGVVDELAVLVEAAFVGGVLGGRRRGGPMPRRPRTPRGDNDGATSASGKHREARCAARDAAEARRSPGVAVDRPRRGPDDRRSRRRPRRRRRSRLGRNSMRHSQLCQAPISIAFHSIWLIVGRAIISRDERKAWMLLPWLGIASRTPTLKRC